MNKDVQIANYFLRKELNIKILPEDEKKYIEWSSQGKHKDDIKMSHFTDGFNALVSGKKMAGIMMGIYEEGVLEGSMPYSVITEEMPPFVIDFFASEMFRGKDKYIIKEIWLNKNF